jgi:hypothetical protein
VTTAPTRRLPLTPIPLTTSQLGARPADSRPHLTPNLAGSALPAVLALVCTQWGFLLLEACWAAVALISLTRHAHRRAHP